MNPVERGWPRGPFYWSEGRRLCVSIPFTWNLPEVAGVIRRGSLAHDDYLVGGPACDLMPEYFKDFPKVTVGKRYPGVLQKVNPLATRTTHGCIRRCEFCGIGQGLIETGPFREFADWPDLPIICDNNLLAATEKHFDRVIDRLKIHGRGDFNQGVDARLLTEHHARRFQEISEPVIYLAMDNWAVQKSWTRAFDLLRAAGIAKRKIRSYAIIGHKTSPKDDWKRCEWVEKHGVKVIPMWFHALDALEHNIVTSGQEEYGWNDFERRSLMQWFFFHKKAVPSA